MADPRPFSSHERALKVRKDLSVYIMDSDGEIIRREIARAYANGLNKGRRTEAVER